MTQYQIGRRILAVAAVFGLLAAGAAGVAACGKPASKPAEASPASPAGPAATPSSVTSPNPAASASPAGNPRAGTCAKIDEAGMKLFGPFMELGAAGDDAVKVKVATSNLVVALNNFERELVKISGETTDDQLKTAISATVTDVMKMKDAVATIGPDSRKLQSVLSSDNFKTGEKLLTPLCAG